MKMIRPLLPVIALLVFALLLQGCTSQSYNKAITRMEAGDFDAAKEILDSIPDYKDAPELSEYCRKEISYRGADLMFDNEDYSIALEKYLELDGFRDSVRKAADCRRHLDYLAASALADKGRWKEAVAAFEAIGDFLDAPGQALRCLCELYLDQVDDLLDSLQPRILSLPADAGEPDTELDYFLAYAAEFLGDMPNEPITLPRLSGAWLRLIELSIDANRLDEAAAFFEDAPDADETGERAGKLRIRLLYEQTLLMSIECLYRVNSLGSDESRSISSDFLSCGDYSYAPQLAEFTGAWGARDLQSISEMLISIHGRFPAVIDPIYILSAFLKSDMTPDEALSLTPLFETFRPSRNGLLPLILPRYSWSMDIDDGIFELCGGNSRGKLLILVRARWWDDNSSYVLPLSLIAALPEEVRPNSLDEVGYIMYISLDYQNDGRYVSGTQGIREFADMALYSAPGKRMIDSYERIMGEPSPADFTYYDEPPKYKSGGSPSRESIAANLYDAIEQLSVIE